MEQHPVPQHVSSYQFKLVGDMTLKQFFQLAGGALISLIFYASHLHPLVRWPGVIIFALFGVALAFLPFQDRPLEKWIVVFFKAIYSPTLYFWEKTKTLPVFFQNERGAPTDEKVIAPGGTEALNNYLSQTPEKRLSFFSKLEEAEKSFLSKTRDLFTGQASTAPSVSAQPPGASPMLYQRVVTSTQVVPRVQVPVAAEPKAELYRVNPSLAQNSTGTVGPAQFSSQAAPPNPPESPNLITGQVMDSYGKIIEAAIMEIKDEEGRPARALKTNKLGHFIIVTPLPNGKYEIITEKDGFTFDPLSFEAKGTIIPPIAIRARREPL